MGTLRKLTPLQERFVEEYLIDLNASASYVRAGFKAKYPNKRSAELMAKPEIQEAITRGMVERSKRTEISADMVIKELARIGFGDLRAIIDWGPDGVILKASGELSDDAAAIVQEVSETHGAGTRTRRVKVNDKVKALELLGKHLGIFTDKIEHSGSVGTPQINLVIHGPRPAS